MLLFYRMLVLVSRPNPRLLLTHPITRTDIAEAIIEFLITNISGNDVVWITRQNIFEHLLRIEPKASALSFIRIWPDLVRNLVYSRYADTQYSDGEQILTIKKNDTRQFIDDIVYKINYKEFEDLDRKDETLKHLFEEDEELYEKSSKFAPNFKFDMMGRLCTTDNGKFDKIEAQLDRMNETAAKIIEIAERIAAKQQPDKIEEKKEMNMAERITKAAAETGTGVLSAIQEGGKISLSQKTNQQIVNLFHKHLGHHIPGAISPVGRKVEAIAIPGLLHFAAAAFSDKLPHVDVVQRACLRAITGESKDGMDEVVDVLLPLFRDIISSEGLVGEAIKEMASVEQIEQAPVPAQIEGHDTRALAESLMEQLKSIPAGEPVEIKLVVSRKETTKQLVPPFEE